MTLSNLLQAYITKKVTLPTQSIIFHEGSDANVLYIVLKGKVTIKKSCPKGRVRIATLGPGELLGEMSLFDLFTAKRSATATAETEVVLGELNWGFLQQEYLKLSQVQQDILAGLSRRIRLTATNAVIQVGTDA